MVFDIGVILTWLLFLALFPMAFFWLRRAWRIFIKKNYAEVAMKRGLPPANPKKWAPFVGLLNLVCGGIVSWIIIGVPFWIFTGILIGPFQSYETWSAIAGMTIWGKIIADLIIRFQAHPIKFGKKKDPLTD
jgi:ABC-type phosphate transport system permease subunit